MIKRVRDCEVMPAWYGVAWRECYLNVAVCLPVPLNIVAHFARSAWIFLRWGYREMPIHPRDAYAQGRRDERIESRTPAPPDPRG